MFKFKPLAAVLLVGAVNAAVSADAGYVQKSLGLESVKLPLLAGFPSACEESKPFAERAASLTPKSSIFLTCFFPEAKWRLLREGKVTDLYPYIVVVVDPPHSSGPFTQADFQKLRKTAHDKLGDLLARSDKAQDVLRAQDRSVAKRGGDLKREDYRQQLSGFFDVQSRLESFSYLTSRSAKVSESGASTELCEINAVTTILYGGRLLRAMVIDDCNNSIHGARSRELTAAWLAALSGLNAERR